METTNRRDHRGNGNICFGGERCLCCVIIISDVLTGALSLWNSTTADMDRNRQCCISGSTE
jgi:hypothetical protein